MIWTWTKQLLAVSLAVILAITTAPLGLEAQQANTTTYAGQGAPLSAEELQALAAPIALYPDALVAQVLGASTFPDQVAYANGWLQQNKNLTGSNLMKAVDAQNWDPAVKALTQFPSVLDNMAKNLSWTSALGEAYHTQAADVMTAIQVLRAKAQASGNLKSGSQITVVQQSPQTIIIQSTNPQVVYVPTYNPTVVYGTAYTTPGYSSADLVATGVIAFTAGIAIGAMMSGGCCGWSYSSWHCGWYAPVPVTYRGAAYYGNPAWHGGYGYSGAVYGPYGGARYGAGYNPTTGTYARGATAYTPYGKASAGQAYNPYTGTYARGGSVSNAYGTQSAAQAYNPRTGAYGATEQGSNAYGSWGSSTVSKNGQTAYSQHQTNAYGTTGSVQTSSGGKAVAGSGAYNSGAAGVTSSGDKYASVNGTQYKNTGSGWESNSGGSWNSVQKPSYSSASSQSASARGWGEGQSGGSSAWGGSGWDSKAASSRGWSSSGGGGGWGGRSGGSRR